MELAELRQYSQNRAAFRTSLLPSELGVGHFWIHDPGVKFSESPLGPSPHVILLEEGVALRNVSAAGALIRVVTPPSIGLLRLISQAFDDPASENRAVPPFRDISFTIRLDLRKDLRDILVSGSIVRTTLVRTSAAFTEYELALKFYNWANITGATVQWYKVRDDSGIPPISAWITQRQLLRHR